jgi:hypothetical protein
MFAPREIEFEWQDIVQELYIERLFIYLFIYYVTLEALLAE